jgi:hypothetical protein
MHPDRVRVALESRRNGREKLSLDELVAEAPLPPRDHDPELADALQQLSPRPAPARVPAPLAAMAGTLRTRYAAVRSIRPDCLRRSD